MNTDYGILLKDGVNYSHDTADSISYDNTTSGATSSNVQDVIDDILTSDIQIGLRYNLFDRTKSGQIAVAAYERFSFDNPTLAQRIMDTGSYLAVPLFILDTTTYNSSRAYYTVMYRLEGRYNLTLSRISTLPEETGYVRFQYDSSQDKYYFETEGFTNRVPYLAQIYLIPLLLDY